MAPLLVCQLCCMPFEVCRIRKFNEHPDKALAFNGPGELRRLPGWNGGNDQEFEAELKLIAATKPVDSIEDILGSPNGCGDGCRHIGIAPDDDPLGHYAGPLCRFSHGYNGYWVATEEMVERTQLCSLRHISGRGSSQDSDSGLCFVIEDGGFANTSNHAVSDATTGGYADLPMHPSCFGIFKRMSKAHFGNVDVDGLWKVREDYGSPLIELKSDLNVWSNDDIPLDSRPTDIRLPSDMNLVLQGDEYNYHPGTEYLATDPLDVPGLDDLIKDGSQGRSSDIALPSPKSGAQSQGVFSRLPVELRLIIADALPRQDMVNLRIASASFTEVPQSYFQRLIQRDMPWVWEVESLPAKEVNWYNLWMNLASADGGSCEDEKKRLWARRQLMQLTERIERMLDDDETVENQAKACADAGTQGREHIMKQWRALKGIGMWKNDKKGTELRGLRSRRRIYGAIEQILDRIDRIKCNDPGD